MTKFNIFLQAATNYVKRIYADFNTFEATWAMVVTWHKFLRFGSNEGFVSIQNIRYTTVCSPAPVGYPQASAIW